MQYTQEVSPPKAVKPGKVIQVAPAAKAGPWEERLVLGPVALVAIQAAGRQMA
jgi:hypothetical protein